MAISIKELCDRYKKTYTGMISDCLDRRGYRTQFLPAEIKLMLGDGVIAGPAYTGVGSTHDDIRANDMDIRVEMLQKVTPDCIAIWTSSEGVMPCAAWGELMARAAGNKGCTAAVIDGYSRDYNFLKDINFPFFSRGNIASSSIGRWSITDYNCKIQIGDTIIYPGDFVVGDVDGVVIVPKELVEEILLEVESHMETESEMREALNKGEDIEEVYNRFGVL